MKKVSDFCQFCGADLKTQKELRPKVISNTEEKVEK